MSSKILSMHRQLQVGSLGVAGAVGGAKECCGRLLGRWCRKTGHRKWTSHSQAKLEWYPFWSLNVKVGQNGAEESHTVGGLLVLEQPNNALRHGRQTLLCRQRWWATGPSCRWGVSALHACGSDCCLMGICIERTDCRRGAWEVAWPWEWQTAYYRSGNHDEPKLLVCFWSLDTAQFLGMLSCLGLRAKYCLVCLHGAICTVHTGVTMSREQAVLQH